MRVYVKNQRNQPLMPTTSRKARMLLKQNKALDGTKIHSSVSYSKLKLLETRKSILIERRMAVSSHD